MEPVTHTFDSITTMVLLSDLTIERTSSETFSVIAEVEATGIFQPSIGVKGTLIGTMALRDDQRAEFFFRVVTEDRKVVGSRDLHPGLGGILGDAVGSAMARHLGISIEVDDPAEPTR